MNRQHDPLLLVDEVAAMGRVSKETIRRDVRAGRLRAVRIGPRRQIRIPRSAWLEYLQSSDAELPDDGERV